MKFAKCAAQFALVPIISNKVNTNIANNLVGFFFNHNQLKPRFRQVEFGWIADYEVVNFFQVFRNKTLVFIGLRIGAVCKDCRAIF